MLKPRNIGMLACAFMIGWEAVAWAQPEKASAAVGKAYYVQANMRFDAQNEIASLNLHEGEMLTIGTRVTIRSADGNRIAFSAEGRGDFVFLRDKYGQRLSIDEFFQRYFSDSDPLAPEAAIHRMSRLEQRNIADGTLAVGMSRTATLMAAGYPPPHRTASTEDATWIYWITRRRPFRVTFDADGKISELRGY